MFEKITLFNSSLHTPPEVCDGIVFVAVNAQEYRSCASPHVLSSAMFRFHLSVSYHTLHAPNKAEKSREDKAEVDQSVKTEESERHLLRRYSEPVL